LQTSFLWPGWRRSIKWLTTVQMERSFMCTEEMGHAKYSESHLRDYTSWMWQTLQCPWCLWIQ
jgi:hypothetical protein